MSTNLDRHTITMVAAAALAAVGCGGGVSVDPGPDARAGAPVSFRVGNDTAATAADFGSVVVDVDSAPMTITVANDAAVATSPLRVVVVGSSLTDFSLDFTGTDCDGAVLAPGATCSVRLGFRPSQLGLRTTTLEVWHEDGGTATLELRGGGATSKLELKAEPLGLGLVEVGTVGAARITVYTRYNQPVAGIKAIVNGAGVTVDPSTTTCTTLAAYGTCEIGLRVAPSVAGLIEAEVTVRGDVDVARATFTGAGAIRLTAGKSEHGAIESVPAGVIACGTTCTALVTAPLELVARADSGHELSAWSDGPCKGTKVERCSVEPGRSSIAVAADFAASGSP